MKTYEEMAESALKRIDEYETVQKKRKKMIVKTACPIISFCFAALLGFGVWQNGWFSTHTGQTETSVTSQAASSDESNSALSSGEPTKPGTSALEGTQNHLFVPLTPALLQLCKPPCAACVDPTTHPRAARRQSHSKQQ